MLNSLNPANMGQDMMTRGGMPPVPDDMIGERMLHRKQAELNEIIEQQRKLYSNLDNLDRQRSQILGDIDKTAAYQKMSSDMGGFFQGNGSGGRFNPQLPSQLRGFSPGGVPSQFSPPPHNFGRSPSSTLGAARDALNGYHHSATSASSTTMDFLANRGKSDVPQSLMHNATFAIPSGFPSSKNDASGTLGSLRGRYEDKLREMEQQQQQQQGSDHHRHMDKRRRFLNNALGAAADNSFNAQKLGLSKNFPHDNLRSSSYLPSEIMVSPKNPTPGDSLSVLNSSHQLLMSQREANMQREAQNMMFYGGMNHHHRGNPMGGIPGFPHRQQPLHDGKLPEIKRKLPKDFVPEVDTVVLGKGNIPKTNIGNLKLKGIVMDGLVEYANGERRKKIAVISRIISHVTSRNYKTTGFVKFEDDSWYEMTERDARVKITALFRDCLHDQYRSSSSSKVKRRQELRKQKCVGSANKDKDKSSSSSAAEEDKTKHSGSTTTTTEANKDNDATERGYKSSKETTSEENANKRKLDE